MLVGVALVVPVTVNIIITRAVSIPVDTIISMV